MPRENALVAAANPDLERGRARLPAAAEPDLSASPGTNGKTTTTEWLGAMFRAAGRDVAVAGNVGRALTGVEAPARRRWIVCELSSFQLEDVHELRPRVAVLLNLEPDHLDRHGTFEAYRDAKLRIFENQRGRHGGRAARASARCRARRRVEFTADDPLPAEPRLPGAHNRENAAAATAAARAAGVPDEAIAEALAHVPGRPAPARARRRARRRPLRERLEGDEHRRRPARARRVRRRRCT